MPLNSQRRHSDDDATSDLPESAEEFPALNDNSPTATNGAANDNLAHGAMTLFQGCCLEALKAIPAQSVHLILADLPYGTTACSWDSVIDLEKLWAEYERIITPTGVIVLTAAQPFTTILAASKLAWLKESLVWEKSRVTGFLQSKKRHLKKHEDILVFSPGTVVSGKGRQTARNMTYNPQGLVELEKPVRSRNGNMKGGTLSYSGGHNSLSPIYRPCYVKPNTKRNGEAATFNGKPITGDGRNQTHTNYPISILRYASERKTVHPTQKPVALMEYLIRTYSNDGDTVLDNVMGSGTTGVACANVGKRHFIGIERDPKYFAGAEARIAAAHEQAPVPLPISVAANDDAPAVGPDEQDEIVARVQAIMATPMRRKAAKAPAWKLRQEARRQDRKVARRVAHQAGCAERLSGANHDVVGAENDNIPAVDFDREGVTVPSDRAVAVLPTLAAANDDKPRVADAEEGEVAIAAPASTPPERHLTVNENGSTTSVTFHQGDCLQAMRGMADGSVDVIVTSPPYNLGTSTDNGLRKFGSKWKNAALQNGYASYSDDMPDEAYVEWLKAVISECWRLIPDDGAIFFNHKPRVQGGACLLPTRFLPPEVILRQEIIWARSGGMNFNQSFFLPTHERVLVLAKPKFRLKKGASGIGDVWTIPQERKNGHPAPFPVELPRRCIAATNAKVIFDPFTGSGTTGVAAQLEGRDFIGCELDPGYLEMARQRLGVQAAAGATGVESAANDHTEIRVATPDYQRPRGQSAPLRLLVNNGDAEPAPSRFRSIDLFAGIGGMRIPFDELGGRCVFSSELDEDARTTYEANFGDKPHGDITKIVPASIPDHDILTGGFPCQAFSIAGKMRGFEDTQGTLFFNIAAILEAKRPRAFLLENVKQLRTHDEGRTYATIERVLTDLGYHVHTKVLNALDFGLPQRRQRTIIVGFRDDVPFQFPAPVGPPPSLGTILEPTGVEASPEIKAKRLARLKAQGDKAFTPSMWHENKSQHISVLPHSVALRSTASHNYILVNGERLPTSRELLRLQGFPEDFKIVVSHAAIRHQTGNAVPVPMIRAVAQNMVAAMRKPQVSGGCSRRKANGDDFGLVGAKFKYLPKEKWAWAA